METFIANLFTPLTPWFMTWSLVAAVATGAMLGTVEAFFVYKLKRNYWLRLFS